ncbi:MAG: multicopper oxidase domain-containing protein, partial [Coriobacteriia bacterium]|nr:multicopper oxidase domain-containing protein [Coriobacteriia bacterium]
AAVNLAFPETWPVDGREGGVPDPATVGPDWIQVGTEGGFLPKVSVVKQQPITWVTDVTLFNAGNVDLHSLLVAPAERADVVVDFSKYAGKTLILYNDAPAAFPAGDPRYDYYTGAPDMRDTGGVDTPKKGYGPNTRTIMQIKVAAKPAAPAFDLASLEAAFASTTSHQGVFEKSQNKIIVPNDRYNSTYNKSFDRDAYVRIYETTFSFKNLDGVVTTFSLEPKAIQDEQGETFDEYGRMSGKLGLERPTGIPGAPNFNLYGYQDPPTEILSAVDPTMVALTPILGDGTQIWKITHNGVDTHPMHFHLYDVQLINRVGWDGFLRYPDDNELGWKDTVRVSPLEDTIVALRPVAPAAPFNVPDSRRPLDPTMPLGHTMGFSTVDPATGQPYVTPVVNEIRNFAWEYVWHCHILSHEEMDMMRPVTVEVASSMPATPVL